MKNGKIIKFNLKLKNIISAFFKNHNKAFIICSLLVFFGICMGIFIVVKNNNKIEIDNMFDKNLLNILKGERGVFGSFFSYLLFYLIICSICIFLTFKGWLLIFPYFMLIIWGYIIGYNISLIILLFGFLGVLNAILIILPLELCLCLVLIIITSFSTHKCHIIKKFGCSYYNKNCYPNINKIYLWWTTVGIFLLLLKSIFFPLIRITIII